MELESSGECPCTPQTLKFRVEKGLTRCQVKEKGRSEAPKLRKKLLSSQMYDNFKKSEELRKHGLCTVEELKGFLVCQNEKNRELDTAKKELDEAKKTIVKLEKTWAARATSRTQ